MKIKKYQLLYFGYFVLISFLVDQLLKRFLLQNIDLAKNIQELFPFFNFVCNKGIAFGFQFNVFLIIFLNFFIIVLLIYLVWKSLLEKKQKIAVCLIIGAAISNFLDRLEYGCVIDYLDFKIWPVFNLADSIITLSVFYLIINLRRKKSPKK
jgi:signal peptidase II